MTKQEILNLPKEDAQYRADWLDGYENGCKDTLDKIINFINETDKTGIDYSVERNSNAIYFNGFDAREDEIYNFVCDLKEQKNE